MSDLVRIPRPTVETNPLIDFARIGAGIAWGATVELNKTTDNWLPANGGTETPFTTRTNRRLLYCWQPSTGKHAYIDCDTDMILSDEEAMLALALALGTS